MPTSIRSPQVCVLGSAEPGLSAYERAGDAGALLASLGVTLVSGCGSPATRVAAELLPFVGHGGWSDGLPSNPLDERKNSPILPWSTAQELEQRLRSLGLIQARTASRAT